MREVQTSTVNTSETGFKQQIAWFTSFLFYMKKSNICCRIHTFDNGSAKIYIKKLKWDQYRLAPY